MLQFQKKHPILFNILSIILVFPLLYELINWLIIRFSQPVPIEVKARLNSEQLNRLLKAVYKLSSVQTIEDIKNIIIQYPILFSEEAGKILDAKIEQLKYMGKSTQTLESNRKVLQQFCKLIK
ncbi:MAG TPA: hypothetical protein ENK59_01330 [Thioploca sp.]|nr:hypothetical protein [Thioploca sp.]